MYERVTLEREKGPLDFTFKCDYFNAQTVELARKEEAAMKGGEEAEK